MSKIIVTEFVSLDGVAQGPHKWSLSFWNKTEKFKYDEMAATGAILLGARPTKCLPRHGPAEPATLQIASIVCPNWLPRVL
jgi:hypothetical protein